MSTEKLIGKGGIEVSIVADSISGYNGVRITTFQLRYHRFFHSEFMTHRVFSRNASSSRAIPVQKMLDLVNQSPMTPIEWGKNKPGMQAGELLNETERSFAELIWKVAARSSVEFSKALMDLGVHKQIANRLTEPFQPIDVIVTATEWDNFYKLRNHNAAQPEIHELAAKMFEASCESEPRVLYNGDWHLPYIDIYEDDIKGIDTVTLIKACVARCARVSYRNHDGSKADIKKDVGLYDMLWESGHLSPFEHIASPMEMPSFHPDDAVLSFKLPGVTHYSVDLDAWSGTFRNWIQFRSLAEQGFGILDLTPPF